MCTRGIGSRRRESPGIWGAILSAVSFSPSTQTSDHCYFLTLGGKVAEAAETLELLGPTGKHTGE